MLFINEDLVDVDKQAEERFERLAEQMKHTGDSRIIKVEKRLRMGAKEIIFAEVKRPQGEISAVFF